MAHTLIGTVTSDKRDKTITVSIVNRETHPLRHGRLCKVRIQLALRWKAALINGSLMKIV